MNIEPLLQVQENRQFLKGQIWAPFQVLHEYTWSPSHRKHASNTDTCYYNI